MKKLYHKIANAGIHPGTPFELRNKITVFNNANIVVCLICIFYALIGLHISAVAFHLTWTKSGVLGRMLPAYATEPEGGNG